MKKIIVGQSGGPTAVINSSVLGVYRKAKELGISKVYGMVYGIEGFLNESFIDLDDYLLKAKNQELLMRTPSAFLGSCRYKLPKVEDNREVYEKMGLKTRAIEFSTLQRAATHLASLTDIEEAILVGEKAVMAMDKGNTGVMVIMERKKTKKYSIMTSVYDIHSIANVEKKVPIEWIDLENQQMKDEYIEYARPLICGELVPVFKDGVVVHLVR